MIQMNSDQLIKGISSISSDTDIISIERRVIEANADYVFMSCAQAREDIWKFVQEILELERKFAAATHTQSRVNFDDSQYRERLHRTLMERIDTLDRFDFLTLLMEGSCDRGNRSWSRFTRQGERIFFSLAYFNPSDRIEQDQIEQKLGLEKKISAVSRTTTYARTEGGLYFRVPYEGFLFDNFPSLQNDPRAQPQAIEDSLRRGEWRLELSDTSGNVYSLCLTLPHLHFAWQQHLLYRGGSLLGVSVVTEIDSDNQDALIRADKRYGEANKVKLTDEDKILYLRDQSLVMTLSLETVADYDAASRIIAISFP